jgi:hypothetical protein
MHIHIHIHTHTHIPPHTHTHTHTYTHIHTHTPHTHTHTHIHTHTHTYMQVTTASIKEYLKQNPVDVAIIDLEALANSKNSAYMNPNWGYSSEAQMVDEAVVNWRPPRTSRIPADFE